MARIIIKTEILVVREGELNEREQIEIGEKVIKELKLWSESLNVSELIQINLEEIYPDI